jgi:8-oxo-dGTP diphosphatase
MNDKLKKLQCIIHPSGSLDGYIFVAICSIYDGKLVLSKHRERDSWETQGGHIEDGESPLDAARRELYEESGIVSADLYRVCDYYGYDDEGFANGVVFLALVREMGTLPESEMSEVGIFDSLPQKLTYPNVTPVFFDEAVRFIELNLTESEL